MEKKKKYCRKILSLLLVLCMSVSLLGVNVFADEWPTQSNHEDDFWVKSMVIGVPDSTNTSIGGSIICDESTGYTGERNFALGKEKGSFYLPIEEAGYRPTFTFLPAPGMKLAGFAIALYGANLNIYGEINASEIPSEVYSFSPYYMDLGTISADGSYTTNLINIPPRSFLEENPSDNVPHFVAAKFVQADPSEIPDKPTNLQWAINEDNNWVLSWNAVDGADHYRCEIESFYSPLGVKITDTNKLVLPADDPELGSFYNFAPCLIDVKVSAVKNKVRSQEAVSDDLHNIHRELTNDDTYHWYECVICGMVDQDSKIPHTYGNWVIDAEATETTSGAKHRECSCGYVQRAVIEPNTPATPVDPNPPVIPNPPVRPTTPNTPIVPSVTIENTFKDKLVVEVETDGNTATLSWNKIDGANKYIIYLYKNEEWVKIKTTTELSATFKKLKNGKDYKFLVRYTKDGKLSPLRYSGECTANAYYKPIVKATATENSVKLTWEEVPGAEKYAVYKYFNGKAVKLTETEKHAVRIQKLRSDTEYSYIVRAYVDGKWTTMQKSDIVTVKTKAE